jgi:hypothetical protein
MVLITIVTGAYRPTYNWGATQSAQIWGWILDNWWNGFKVILDSCCGKAKNRASHSPTTGGHSKHFSDPRGFVQLFSSCHVVLGMVVGLDITITYVVGGFKHFIVSIIYGIIPPLTNIFQDGWLKPPTSYVYKCVCVSWFGNTGEWASSSDSDIAYDDNLSHDKM